MAGRALLLHLMEISAAQVARIPGAGDCFS